MNDQRSDSSVAEPSGPIAQTLPTRRSRWLEGIHGTLRFLVGETPVATMIIDDGEARLAKDEGAADTTIVCRDEDDVGRLLRGELNPVIVGLLGRLEIEGDVVLGIQVLNFLRDASVSPASEA